MVDIILLNLGWNTDFVKHLRLYKKKNLPIKKWPKYGKNLFLGLKNVSNSGFWPRKFFWPNYCKKLFSGPKQGPNSGFWPRKIFRLNWSKNGQNMV